MLTLRDSQRITPMTEKSVVKHRISSVRYRVVEGRFVPGEWCIEIANEDGGYETVTFFRGPEARERAITHARDRFGEFDETLKPTTDAEPGATLAAAAGDLRREKLRSRHKGNSGVNQTRAAPRRGSPPSGSGRNTAPRRPARGAPGRCRSGLRDQRAAVRAAAIARGRRGRT